jgi:hypothetical protein
MSVSIVTWLWHDGSPRANEFCPAHVNVLRKMIARTFSLPHRFICVADSKEGFDPEVEVFIAPPEAVRVGQHRTPEVSNRFPSCYRRLWMFSPEAKALGDRVMLLDIDVVVLRDLAPLFDRTEDFVGWRPFRDWGNQKRFGGGIYLYRTGTRNHVWETFKGQPSILEARRAGYRGSDQAWISYRLAQTEPYYERDSGIYSIRDFKTPCAEPPSDARIVQLNGPCKPWKSDLPWIKANWK